MDEETGYMTEEQVNIWLEEWIKTPGLVNSMKEIQNRKVFVENLLKALGVWT